jgi:hypothetical protein
VPLSRRWNSLDLWKHAIAPLADFDKMPLAWVERFDLISMMEFKIVSAFFAPMSGAYMTAVPISVDASGNYATGSASWTALTKLLTAVMSTNFSANDVGKTVVFRTGTSTYQGVINSFITTTTVTLQGNALPSADIASLDAVIVVNTAITNDILSLGNLAIMRSGDQVKLELESSVTDDVVPMTLEELNSMQTGDPRHTQRIAWAYSGEYLWLKSPLASYGALILRYPRVPDAPASDTDMIDLPDGPATTLGMSILRKMVADRYLAMKFDNTAEIMEGVKAMLQNYGIQATSEDLKKKVESLK